ncbi:Arc family DNA-binding protein [Ancylomarina sp. YFZ004]
MTKKKSFVLRLNPEIYKKLEKWAADEFRSSNGQIEWIINKALKESGRIKKEVPDSEEINEPED